MSDDGGFLDDIENADVYRIGNGRLVKTLLWSVEIGGDFGDAVPSFDEANVEHVFPQTPTDQWRTYLANDERLDTMILMANRIGNLTLIDSELPRP